jgi:two-component system sensor histidine kinase RegB
MAIIDRKSPTIMSIAVERPARPMPTHWRPLRHDTLVGLRWLAIGGQTAGVLIVQYAMAYPLPLWECLGLIGLSVLVNLLLTARFSAGIRLSPRFAAMQLAYDCLQLGGLLALTGGLQNPFSLLLLAPVSVSATTLPLRATIFLSLLVAVIASILAVYHLPLPWDPKSHIVFNRVYVTGIWVSLLCGVVFIAAYTNRVAHEARQLADALAATELALSRHEQLSALDGLAAAAAHELGTPLSTIALAAKEMRSDIPPGPLAEDVDLIIAQAARCRAILGKLRNLGADAGDPFVTVPLPDLLAEVAKPYQGRGKSILIEPSDAETPAPVFRRNVGLLYGLGNLIENATHFAASSVLVETDWDRDSVAVTITDDGPGYPPELLTRLGEPYLTTRDRNPEAGEAGGLGLGIFIAKTLLERGGASLAFENAEAEGHARVRVVWPRSVINVQKAGGDF